MRGQGRFPNSKVNSTRRGDVGGCINGMVQAVFVTVTSLIRYQELRFS